MKKLLLVLAVAVALLLISGAVLVMGKQAEPIPSNLETARWLQTGAFVVHSHEESFIDTSRPTNPNGDFAGAPQRQLDGIVWHPASNDGGPFPLVVYSHGFTSSRDGGAYIQEFLASHGYVVVAVNYPLTNMNAPGGPNVKDVVNQPGDVSSLGGLTSTLAAFHPDWADERIKASLSIAGPTALFTPEFFRHREVPFLMLAGDIDALVPYPTNAAPVPEVVPGGELVTVKDASHTGFAGPAAGLRWMDNPDALGCYVVLRTVEDGETDTWYDLLGTPDQGINYSYQDELCLMDPLPEAINPLRQHMITLVTVLSFFESKFADDVVRRADARRFLSDVLPSELAEVSFKSALNRG